MNCPKIRFPEFDKSWEEVQLKDIASFYKGKGISKNETSEKGIPCIRYGELYTKYDENITDIYSKTNLEIENLVLSEKNDILIPCSGETAIDLATASCVRDKNVAIGGDITIIKTNQYAPFITYCLNNKRTEIAKYAQGVSIVHLYAKDFQNMKIKIPQISEQKKIVDLFENLNKKIDSLEKTQEKLEKLNFDLINKIMEQNYKIPNRTYDWRRISLYKIGNSFTGLSGKNKEDFSNGNSNFIPYSSIFNDIILDPSKFEQVDINESENQNLVEKGDIFFTGSSETPDDVGMASVLLDDLKNCYLNSFCFGFRLKSSEEYNPLFLVYYFRSLKFKKELFKLAQGSTRFNISKKELLKKEIEVPSKEDQDYYVNLINNMFAKTKHINTELCYMKNFKKGLLQKMFV